MPLGLAALPPDMTLGTAFGLLGLAGVLSKVFTKFPTLEPPAWPPQPPESKELTPDSAGLLPGEVSEGTEGFLTSCFVASSGDSAFGFGRKGIGGKSAISGGKYGLIVAVGDCWAGGGGLVAVPGFRAFCSCSLRLDKSTASGSGLRESEGFILIESSSFETSTGIPFGR